MAFRADTLLSRLYQIPSFPFPAIYPREEVLAMMTGRWCRAKAASAVVGEASASDGWTGSGRRLAVGEAWPRYADRLSRRANVDQGWRKQFGWRPLDLGGVVLGWLWRCGSRAT